MDEAEALEIEQEGALLEDEEASSMAFYARVFALKVVWYLVDRSLRVASCMHLASAASQTHHHHHHCAGLPGEG